MDQNWLDRLPEPTHATAREAVSSAFGSAPVQSLDPVLGGASGALTFRLGVADRFYLMRLEVRRSPLRNPHQYECMRIASEAGVAPPLRYFNGASGVAIMDFIEGKPLETYPGGPAALASTLARLASRLQATTPFPVLGDYRAFLSRMLGFLKTKFAPGLLDEHLDGFERIRGAYPWDADKHVSAHNDPNPRNILFDGERLWLIDWETSYRNDALTDIAILTENHAASPELEEILVTSWLGHAPDSLIRAKLRLMRQLTRLYYAGLLVVFGSASADPIQDLTAPTPDEFREQLARGEHSPASIDTRVTLGKMCLAAFRADLHNPAFDHALRTCQGG